MKAFLKKYVGDRAFYSTALGIAVPIMIQMGITNLVSLLDNVMVGRLGTESMSGVSIANQFIFVFTIFVLGAIAAIGIFAAQYHGAGDVEGVRYAFRFKLLLIVSASVVATVAFTVLGDGLITLFLHDDGSGANLALTHSEASRYLSFAVIGLIPLGISQIYASSLRETGVVVPPMVASVTAVFTNLILNILLIFGLLGFPALGVAGAAIATTVSRFVELAILLIWSHTHKKAVPFLEGAYRSLHIPLPLIRDITVRGLPLLINEILWVLSITTRSQCYSTRGLDALAATSISSTVQNVFNTFYLALGSAIAILVGNRLGAGKTEEAKDVSRKMITLSVALAFLIGGALALLSPYFSYLYEVGEEVHQLTAYILLVSAMYMPAYAFFHSAYFTVRSGGRVLLTMLLDSGFMWAVVIPITAGITYLSGLDIRPLFLLGQGAELLKIPVCATVLKKTDWARRFI